jgi:hypothetical protein
MTKQRSSYQNISNSGYTTQDLVLNLKEIVHRGFRDVSITYLLPNVVVEWVTPASYSEGSGTNLGLQTCYRD